MLGREINFFIDVLVSIIFINLLEIGCYYFYVEWIWNIMEIIYGVYENL